jgi:hypothetical protein
MQILLNCKQSDFCSAISKDLNIQRKMDIGQPVTDIEDTFIGNVTLEHEIGDVTVVIGVTRQ